MPEKVRKLAFFVWFARLQPEALAPLRIAFPSSWHERYPPFHPRLLPLLPVIRTSQKKACCFAGHHISSAMRNACPAKQAHPLFHVPLFHVRCTKMPPAGAGLLLCRPVRKQGAAGRRSGVINTAIALPGVKCAGYVEKAGAYRCVLANRVKQSGGLRWVSLSFDGRDNGPETHMRQLISLVEGIYRVFNEEIYHGSRQR